MDVTMEFIAKSNNLKVAMEFQKKIKEGTSRYNQVASILADNNLIIQNATNKLNQEKAMTSDSVRISEIDTLLADNGLLLTWGLGHFNGIKQSLVTSINDLKTEVSTKRDEIVQETIDAGNNVPDKYAYSDIEQQEFTNILNEMNALTVGVV
jgi:hypothetical protein